MTPLSWERRQASLNCSRIRELQKVVILYRLIWKIFGKVFLFMVENPENFLADS